MSARQEAGVIHVSKDWEEKIPPRQLPFSAEITRSLYFLEQYPQAYPFKIVGEYLPQKASTVNDSTVARAVIDVFTLDLLHREKAKEYEYELDVWAPNPGLETEPILNSKDLNFQKGVTVFSRDIVKNNPQQSLVA